MLNSSSQTITNESASTILLEEFLSYICQLSADVSNLTNDNGSTIIKIHDEIITQRKLFQSKFSNISLDKEGEKAFKAYMIDLKITQYHLGGGSNESNQNNNTVVEK